MSIVRLLAFLALVVAMVINTALVDEIVAFLDENIPLVGVQVRYGKNIFIVIIFLKNEVSHVLYPLISGVNLAGASPPLPSHSPSSPPSLTSYLRSS